MSLKNEYISRANKLSRDLEMHRSNESMYRSSARYHEREAERHAESAKYIEEELESLRRTIDNLE